MFIVGRPKKAFKKKKDCANVYTAPSQMAPLNSNGDWCIQHI